MHLEKISGSYFLTSPGAGVGFGAPELSFSAGILCEPAAPVVDGDGLALVPPVVPLGFRSTAPLLPPACSSICLVVPGALAADMPVTRAAVATSMMIVFIGFSRSSYPLLAPGLQTGTAPHSNFFGYAERLVLVRSRENLRGHFAIVHEAMNVGVLSRWLAEILEIGSFT
jgi:hypothetical protein